MKERKIKIIVTLMTLAVIGLISVQMYWIFNLIRVEDERFHRIVNDALMRVSHRIEEEEAANAVVKKITHKSVKDFKKIKGPERGFVSNDVYILNNGSHEKTIKIVSDSDHFNYTWEGSVDSLPRKTNLKYYQQQDFDADKIPPPPYLHKYFLDTLTSSRKKLVQSVVTEIMNINFKKRIEDRISVKQLNNLLSQEFKNSGIDGNFDFAVDKLVKDSLTLIKPGTDVASLKNSDLRTMLFPSEFLFNKNELIVYFPNKTLHLLGSIAGMMGLSVGLILIIVMVFFSTLRMLLRQKKITQVKNDLINNITHEFKTPISTISLACEAINEPGLMTEKDSLYRYSNIIREENNRLKMMVDALLNTAAMEKSDFNLKKEYVDLHNLIENAASKYVQTVIQRNGNIELELSAGESIISGDAFHLNNIFSNLIDNAIKYNENEPRITIKTLNSDNSILIVVEDNGIGIAKEHLGKIFDTFYRVGGGNIQNVRGNGIGLSYVKKIIEEHGGKISVHSEVSKGSRFEIHLPLESKQ